MDQHRLATRTADHHARGAVASLLAPHDRVAGERGPDGQPHRDGRDSCDHAAARTPLRSATIPTMSRRIRVISKSFGV